MSWFKRSSPLRSSISRRIQAPMIDSATCFEAFRNHWSQVWAIIEKNGEGRSGPPFSMDGITAVVNHLDQLVTLLLQETTRTCPAMQGTFLPAEDPSSNGAKEEWTMGPILDFLLTEGILDKLHNFSLRSGEFVNAMKLEQLKIYEVLVSHSHPNLLFQKPVVRPLLHLLSECQECCPLEVEKRLIILLNTLCVCLSQHPQLLEVFFSASSEQEPAQFLIFTLLIPFVHREGAIGQQARDALLLCMALSHRNENIGTFIAEHSNFCPVLATGLSGLYSVLPRKLVVVSEDWYHFTPEDIQDMPELEMFLNSLEFCNAVIQVAHPLVREQLLDYIYQGFLLPVLGPALNQTSVEEVIAATAYLELCLRSLSEPSLIQLFLRFILCDSYEEQKILETLVKRIEAQSKLALVTMALFKTLLDLNCEDVMLELVLKFLIPCTHVMVSQRSRVRDVDVYCQTAEKLLSLIPTCCFLLPETPMTASGHSLGGFPRTAEESDYPVQPFIRTGSLRVKSRRTLSTSSFTFGDSSHATPGFEADHRFGENFQSPYPSHQASYQTYLREARQGLLACAFACRNWSVPYNGLEPPAQPKPSSHQSPLYSMTSSCYFSESEPVGNKTEQPTQKPDVNGHSKPLPHRTVLVNQALSIVCNEDNTPMSVCSTSSSGVSSADGQLDELPSLSPDSEIIFCNGGTNTYADVKDSVKAESVNAHVDGTDKGPVGPCPVVDGFSSPDIGPFLNVLLSRLEMMMQNDVYTNLQLTGLISRLALYPQPLIRSFLLNHTLVFQPSIRSLIQVLNTLKQKMDSYSTSVDKFENLLMKARAFLAAREERLLRNPPPRVYAEAAANRKVPQTTSNLEFQRGDSRRRSFTNFLFRGKSMVREPLVESIPDQQGYRYVSKPSSSTNEGQLEYMQSRNAALCAVILEEFLMELAAVTQEQALIDACPDVKPFFLTL